MVGCSAMVALAQGGTGLLCQAPSSRFQLAGSLDRSTESDAPSPALAARRHYPPSHHHISLAA